MADLHDLPATALLALYRHGDVSPVEAIRAVLDHIARWEPHLHATYLRMQGTEREISGMPLRGSMVCE